jgi:hypothetical protein
MGFIYYYTIVNNINLFKDRLFYTSNKKRCSDKEVEFVKLILSKINKPIKSPSNIELISINDEYDLYRFEYKNISFCLKVSLDPECSEIKKEFKNLKKINQTISPFLCESGVIKIGDDISYLLTTFENAESVYSFGNSVILSEFDSFCYSYKLFQNSKPITNNYKNNLINFFKNNDLNLLPQDCINMIKKDNDFDTIYQFIETLKDDLKNLTDERLNENKFICHGKLTAKNILYKNGLFKFINFSDCFSSHCFLDLADLFISIGINQKLEREMLTRFCEYFNIDFEENKKLYILCSSIAIRKKIINIIFDYFKEIYVFSAFREDKLIYLTSQFSDNYQRFLTIKPFFENREFFLRTIAEPFIK